MIQLPPPSPPPAVAPALVIDSLKRQAQSFLATWASLHERYSEVGYRFRQPTTMVLAAARSFIPDFRRVDLAHCHPTGGAYPRPSQFIIEGGAGVHAVCPTWVIEPDLGLVGDERLFADRFLPLAYGLDAVVARAHVIEALKVFADIYPTDPWIVGQQVRFLTDQLDSAGARQVVKDCRAVGWWCQLLTGYVDYWRGDYVRADSVFTAALTSLPPPARCAFTDLRVLLVKSERGAYDALGCAGRGPTNERIWWLAKPLLTDRVNERRVEHYARWVLTMLRTDVEKDHPYDWSTPHGGQGVREMVVRYGWPYQRDILGGHQGYLKDSLPKFITTNEYPLDRLHLFPAWRAVADPFSARPTDWIINMDAGERWAPSVNLWWPQEHAATSTPLLPILFQQVASFRRDTNIVIAMAADLLATNLPVPAGTALRGSFVTSDGPSDVHVEPIVGNAREVIRYHTALGPRPTLAEIELILDNRRAAARTRFGLRPPPTLASLTRDSLALSDIAFFDPPTEGDPPSDPPRVFARMLGSNEISPRARLGIYWESYGIAARDSTDITIDVSRMDRPGFFRRVASSLRLASRPGGGIAGTWRDLAQTATPIPGRIPTLGRSLALNTQQLQPGNYRVTITLSTPGKLPATTTKDLVIR